MTDKREILTYIKAHWKETIREELNDKGDLIGVPYPYTVPCLSASFQEMYYWDTYFTCRGLLRQGFFEQVKNNCNNFIYLIERFGFIPNGTRTWYLSRSQLPYFGALIELVYKVDKDHKWLAQAVSALEKEMDFWMNSRLSHVGLNRQGYNIPEVQVREAMIANYDNLCVRRLGMDRDISDELKVEQGSHTVAEAECWDFTPRFEQHCLDYNPIDLNSLLYNNEVLLARFHMELGSKGLSELWLERSLIRKKLINTYCWSEERGVFLDYDFKNDKHSPVLSAASLQPLWVGLATADQAKMTVLAIEKYLEFEFGLSTCEKYDSGTTYQWDYPNGWPPMQMIAIDSLDRYGYKEQAGRIAQKYITTVINCFEETGDLWEKYNVLNGSVKVKDEYDMPAMMGWTAASFIEACDYLIE